MTERVFIFRTMDCGVVDEVRFLPVGTATAADTKRHNGDTSGAHEPAATSCGSEADAVCREVRQA